MNIKGFKDRDGVVHKYDHDSLANIPETSEAVKSVNGIAPDENGNVEITIPDSSQNVDLTGYAKETWVQEGFQPKGEYLTEHQDLSEYAKKTEIPSVPVQSVNGKTGAVDLTASDVGALPNTTVIPSVPTKVSAFENDKGYLTDYTETDPTVPSWAKAATKPTYTAAEVGALPDTTVIPTVPTKISAFDNDSGYITGYTETDPTVPSWAKQSTKPTYTAAEVGALPDTTVIPTVPTKVSAFTNDAGYLTQHQDISGKADKSGLTLGIHTDGLVYLFVSGQPVGSGIAFTGGDIIGNVDSQNNILLTGNLADGTYTLKYENKDGTYTDVGTLVVSELVKYVNLFSQDGEGFANNTDFSGASNGRFVTNYIPCKDGNVLHVKGATIYKLKAHNSVDNAWGSAVYAASLGEAVSSYDDTIKVYNITQATTGVSNIDKVQCEIRSGNTALDSVIITVNQDIVD